MLPADWKIKIIFGKGHETRFFLRKSILLSSKKWKRPVKEYLGKLDYGVDLEELFRPYLNRVIVFQAWYIAAIELAGDWVLKEYREYQRIIKGIGWRSSYRIILHIASSAKIDPFKHLDEYLFPNEIEYVQSTQDLKQKVDRIIEVLDEYKACDEELRSEAYKLFGVD